MPVLVEPRASRHAYNPTMPAWGSAYYDGFWSLVEDCIAPPAGGGNELGAVIENQTDGRNPPSDGPPDPESHPTPSRE